MPHPEVVHIAPVANDWRLHRTGGGEDRYFKELGEALDAASALSAEGFVIRIVVHQSPTAAGTEHAVSIGYNVLAHE